MAIEYKNFTVVYGAYDENDIISHREAFGWIREDSNKTNVKMHRDTEIENYIELKKIESGYDKAIVSYKKYKNRLRPGFIEDWQLFLLWFFIVPGILFKMYQRQNAKKAKQSLKMAESSVFKAQELSNSVNKLDL